MIDLKIKKLHMDAVIPVYARPGDAGMDLSSVDDIVISPLNYAMVATGLAVELPEGYEAFKSAPGAVWRPRPGFLYLIPPARSMPGIGERLK